MGDKATAPRLLPATLKVLSELGRVGLLKRLASIVSDGAAVEKRILDLILDRYSSTTSTIHSPDAAFEDVTIKYALMGGTRVVFPIDAKHTSKNSFNAQGTGAKLLTTGDDVVTYSQLVDIVKKPGSPLFKRDVVRRDRQDDQAMERYLSSELLQHVVTHTPNRLGLVVYLFVFGELHSAVQSRSLPHTTRAQMLLTVEYFLQGWKKFQQRHPDYGADHFLPSSFYDICGRLIRACLGLIYIFRDAQADQPEPLLHWRHMTEALEHFFGAVRSQVQEFDILEFAQIAKKALTLMDLERKSSQSVQHDEEARARMGYQHTHDRISDLNLKALATFPSDVQFGQIALAVGVSVWM